MRHSYCCLNAEISIRVMILSGVSVGIEGDSLRGDRLSETTIIGPAGGRDTIEPWLRRSYEGDCRIDYRIEFFRPALI